MNRTIAIFSLAAVATGVALTASGASAGTLYSNNFTTRTSSDATTNAEGHLLVDFQLGSDGAPVFELAPEKRNDEFGLVFSILRSRSLSPWETVGESFFSAEDGDMLCRPPVNTSTEPCMFFKYRIITGEE